MASGLEDLPDDQLTTLDELPPSCKLLTFLLLTRGEMSQRQLIEESLLTGQTVRKKLGQLIEAGIVHERVAPMDNRKKLYSLCAGRGETEAKVDMTHTD